MAPTHYKKKHRKYRIHYGRIFLALLTFATLITGVVSLTAFFFRPAPKLNFLSSAPVITPVTTQIEGSAYYADSLRARRMSEAVGEIYSSYALLMEVDSGKVLFRKNEEAQAYPASLTKMMTLVLALEALSDLDQRITLPSEIFTPLYQMNASMAGFQPESSPTVRDLLYGTMLPSGAECAIGLGRAIAGSDEGFVEMMNDKARELGMDGTRFQNSTGLHEDGHYSTAADMAKLVRYALDIPAFRELFGTATYVTEPTSAYPSGIHMSSTMFHKVASPDIGGGRGTLLGGKTGYTGEAGLCLASLAEVDGVEYILITMGADGSNATEPFHILDAFTVYGHIPDYWGD